MNTEYIQSTVQALQERFGAQVYEFRGQLSLVLDPAQIVPVAQALRDEFDYEMLSALSAVDYYPQEDPRFHVIYWFRSLKNNALVGARVRVPGVNPSVPTVEGVYPNANWHEREVYDMFGITIQGHSDPRRIIMPHDWVGHPLRKDYPLGYEEVRFSFNHGDVDLRKPTPQE